MPKANKTVAFRPSPEIWERLEQEGKGNYSSVIEEALRQYYGIPPSNVVRQSVIQSNLPLDEESLRNQVESWVNDALASYRDEMNEAIKHNLENHYQQPNADDWSQLNARLTEAESNIQGIRVDVQSELTDALEEIRERYNTTVNQLQDFNERVIALEEINRPSLEPPAVDVDDVEDFENAPETQTTLAELPNEADNETLEESLETETALSQEESHQNENASELETDEGLMTKDLAKLLEVNPDTISKWKTAISEGKESIKGKNADKFKIFRDQWELRNNRYYSVPSSDQTDSTRDGINRVDEEFDSL